MHWNDGSWTWWMPVGMVLVWLVVAVVVVVLVRAFTRPPDGGDPRAVLDERYARGEIDDEEYRRRRATLRDRRGG